MKNLKTITIVALLFCGALTQADTLYVSTHDAIMKFDPSGQGTVFASGLLGPGNSGPVGLAVDQSDNLYAGHSWAGTDGGRVFKFDSSGNMSVFASGLTGPKGLAFDSSGNLYVACQGSTLGEGGGTIWKFDPSGNGSVFASGLTHPNGLAVDGGGNLYAATDDDRILRFNPSGQQTVFASGHSVRKDGRGESLCCLIRNCTERDGHSF